MKMRERDFIELAEYHERRAKRAEKELADYKATVRLETNLESNALNGVKVVIEDTSTRFRICLRSGFQINNKRFFAEQELESMMLFEKRFPETVSHIALRIVRQMTEELIMPELVSSMKEKIETWIKEEGKRYQ